MHTSHSVCVCVCVCTCVCHPCTCAEGSSVKWYDWVDTSSHLEAVGNLAAHVHITTVELLKRSHCGSVISDLVSPKTFIECLKMTQRIATEMKLKEKVQ